MSDSKNPMVGDEHDDGLWPDYDLATESVADDNERGARPRAFESSSSGSKKSGPKASDTKITEPKKS